jgi:hypothetical protein
MALTCAQLEDEGRRAAIYAVFSFFIVIFCFWGVNFLFLGHACVGGC